MSDKNIVFIKPINDKLVQFKNSIENQGYEIFEIEDPNEIAQTLPILDEAIIFSTDLKLLKSYLEDLKEHISQKNFLHLLFTSKITPPHVLTSLNKIGKIQNHLENIDLEKINSICVNFFSGKAQVEIQNIFLGHKIISKPELGNSSEVWELQKGVLKEKSEFEFGKITLGKISNNISNSSKQNIEKLLLDFNNKKESSILSRLKRNELKLFEFKNDNEKDQGFSEVIFNKQVDELINQQAPSKELNLNKIIQNLPKASKELNFNYSDDKQANELKSNENKEVIDNRKIFKNYEEENNQKLLEMPEHEIADKFGESLLEFNKKIKKYSEEEIFFELDGVVYEQNPFLSSENNLQKDKSIQEFEDKKQLTLIAPAENYFNYMIGLAELIDFERKNMEKVIQYVNFIFHKLFSAYFVPIIIKDSELKILFEPWRVTKFQASNEFQNIIKDKSEYFKEISIPQFDIIEDWSVYYFPYSWNNQKIGLGFCFSKEKLPELNSKFYEFFMMSTRSLIFDAWERC